MNNSILAEQSFSKCLILLRSAYNLIQCTIESSDKNTKSPLALLFNQTWFVQLFNSANSCEHRELIAISLIQAAILVKNYKNPSLSVWLRIAFEIADACSKVLDLDTSFVDNQKTFNRCVASLSYIAFIEELSRIILNKDNRDEGNAKRILFFLTEIAKKFTNTLWEMSTIKGDLVKVYSILLISKYWEPDDICNEFSQSLAKIIVHFRIILENLEIDRDKVF